MQWSESIWSNNFLKEFFDFLIESRQNCKPIFDVIIIWSTESQEHFRGFKLITLEYVDTKKLPKKGFRYFHRAAPEQ